VHIKSNFHFELKLYSLYVLLQALISAVANVFNEYLYKTDISVAKSYFQPLVKREPPGFNEQNTYLYFFTSSTSVIYLAIVSPQTFVTAKFFRGFGTNVLLIILLAGTLGIIVGLILKFQNVMVKIYVSVYNCCS